MDAQLLRLKEELSKVYMEKQELTHPSVVAVSQQMDKVIVKLQRQLMTV